MIRIKHSATQKRTNWTNFIFGCKLSEIPTETDKKLTHELLTKYKHTKGLHLLEVYLDEKKLRIWLDNANGFKFYPEVIGKNDLYFKITCTRYHLQRVPNRIYPYAESMLKPDKFHKNRKRLIKLVSEHKYLWDISGLFRCYNKDNRKKLIAKILELDKWNSRVLTCGRGIKIPKSCPNNWKISVEKYWKLITQTKINLGLRGCGYWDFRTIIAWGIGACALMFPENNLIEFPHTKPIYITCKLNYSDFEQTVDYFLHHKEERLQIAQNGLEFYNKYYTPEATVNWILDIIKKHIE